MTLIHTCLLVASLVFLGGISTLFAWIMGWGRGVQDAAEQVVLLRNEPWWKEAKAHAGHGGLD